MSITQLTQIGLGAGTLGNLYKAVSDEEARATIDTAWDGGVRYFDTAPFYGMGLSERRLGDALRVRDAGSYILSSKVGRLLRPIAAARSQFGFETPMPFEPVFDYSYDGIWCSWEASLQRLGLSRIDILYMHDIGRLTHGNEHPVRMEEAKHGLRALESMRDQGLVDRIGIGVNEVDVCFEVLDLADIDTILLAGQYNLLQRERAEPLFKACADRGVTIVAAGVYASGILASGVRTNSTPHFNYEPAPAAVVQRVQGIEALCADFDVSLATAALQFVLQQPAVESVLLGMTGRQRVERNLSSVNEDVPEAFWAALEEQGLLAPITA